MRILNADANSIEAPVEGDMGGQRFFTPTRALKISSSHSPKIFPDSKHSHILKQQNCARPPPPAQLLDERRGWTL